jgi:hypothetical protein
MGYLDFANKLKNLTVTIEANREVQSIQIAQELRTLVRNRVQNDKEDSNGNSYGEYSEAVVPQSYYYGKSLSQGAEDKIKAGDWFLSYQDFKEANNQPIDAKNFTFTGDMWRNTGVTDVENTNTSTTVSYGGQTQRSSDLIGHHSEREGLSIISANEKEIKFVTEAHSERIADSIKEIFG